MEPRAVFRGVGQIFFQENALSGICFVAGIAVGSPLMACAAVIGSAIGMATARGLKFDDAEVDAGIFGFNPALVGVATLFFFTSGIACWSLLVAGCVLSTLLTRIARRQFPFPTYTMPFIVTTWVIYFAGPTFGAERAAAGGGPDGVGTFDAIANGVAQVIFQANRWTGALFLVGIAVSDRTHAVWVFVGSVVGMLMAGYHATAGSSARHVETLIANVHADNIALGLYGYNATLAAVALFLWRKSVIPPLLGMLLSVPITELLPTLGIPALTAPFVFASWLVMGLGSLENKLLRGQSPAPS